MRKKTAYGRSFCVSNKLFGDTIPLQPYGDRVVDHQAVGLNMASVGHHIYPRRRGFAEGCTKGGMGLYGAGLWGPIWGYVALNADKQTIYGTYFAHASETPGLGAEITNRDKFQVPFIGKKAVDGEGNVVISVVKFGKVKDETVEVDGISGGTITSNGVDAMLKNCLGFYKPFLTKGACAAKACEAAQCAADSACVGSVPAAKIEVVNQ